MRISEAYIQSKEMMEWQLTVSSVSLLYASIVCNVFSLKDKLELQHILLVPTCVLMPFSCMLSRSLIV